MSQPERTKIDGDRYYKVGSNTYPSVTTVSDTYPPKQEALSAANVPDHEVERAGLLGTLAHHRILDDYAVRKLPPPEIDLSLVDDDLKSDIQVCELLWEDCDFDMGDSPYIEKRIVSHEHGYAGTLDALVNETTVMDLKTSKSCYPSHKLQISAYAKAVEENDKLPDPTDAAIVVLHPKPENNPHMTPKVHRLDQDDIDEWFDEFLGLLSNFK